MAFCAKGTANDECRAPHQGGTEYDNVTAWCMANYGETDCDEIRAEAEADALAISRFVGMLCLVLVLRIVLQVANFSARMYWNIQLLPNWLNHVSLLLYIISSSHNKEHE